MPFHAWLAAVGALLLLMALSSAYIRKLPVTTAIVYLAIGMGLGPAGSGVLSIDLDEDAGWFLRVTELAVIASLFVGGLKLRLPFRDPAWRAPLRLAGPAMTLTMAGTAVCLVIGLGVPWSLALLAAAILAPTDPVLAGEVSVSQAADDDRLRYGLSGEAGLNDGSAFPFVVLGLTWMTEGALGGWVGSWFLWRVLYAVPVGLAVGYACGRQVGRLGIVLRQRQRDLHAPSDFLCLAVIALAYAAAEAIAAWGFLSVFAAGVGMRHAERRVARDSPHPAHEGAPPGHHPPAEDVVPQRPAPDDLVEPTVAAGVMVGESLVFGDTLERLLEVVLVVLVGVLLVSHADVAGLLLALVLLVVIRPVAVFLAVPGTPVTMSQRRLMAWFGIRGIGSLFYLAYARVHGLDGAAADLVTGLVVTVIAASIVAHGVTGQPLLDRYHARLAGAAGGAAADTPAKA